MFLAINEIRYSKLRYALVIGVMFLIAYLVFFLTGLAYGLAQDNRTAIDNWQADDILLADEANNNLNMSMIPLTKFEEVKAEEKAYLTQTAGVIQKEKGKEKIDVTFFGINQDQFLAPKISDGRMFHSDDETVADSSVKEQYELSLGDTVQLAGSDKKLKIVGFTKNAKFSVAPVLYTTVGAYQEIRFETQGSQTSEKTRVNAIVTRGNVSKIPDDLKKISIKTFINDLPGYSAQVLTFGFMIGFLIVIAAIVIGIFIYVLTMQKADVFGVMKAQGISSRYIANSVIVQTFLLAIIGVATGLVGTLGTSLLLPEAVPFQVNLLFFLSISILMIVIAVLGALFSVRTIVKIDPLKAIG
ncbi:MULTISPECIES: ABC transporter permease [Enterococcus]|uniref:Putative hemin transport system permease protein HrtB n=1 Tax=Enterococcus thailandicus TaxID=417368 RepID=A0A179ERJ4_ENTTH|nr:MULTISPECIES: ABC transporter permease [Enterococcus]MDA3964770.1 ABC transporter permease [Enterococcus thailandicus]MDK4352281.1 ABC transporter permease [Enterococcus thailandicus]MDT2735029.1 ABC transporter permease [Enterococcus thailandicus]MDT2751298.1 ABC transporter permease [Enterococcus thailandicus]MDT2776575.1 ABC transporter permease [Enterococcus thailandicus]